MYTNQISMYRITIILLVSHTNTYITTNCVCLYPPLEHILYTFKMRWSMLTAPSWIIEIGCAVLTTCVDPMNNEMQDRPLILKAQAYAI